MEGLTELLILGDTERDALDDGLLLGDTLGETLGDIDGDTL